MINHTELKAVVGSIAINAALTLLLIQGFAGNVMPNVPGSAAVANVSAPRDRHNGLLHGRRAVASFALDLLSIRA
jgi:hypothetical protein